MTPSPSFFRWTSECFPPFSCSPGLHGAPDAAGEGALTLRVDLSAPDDFCEVFRVSLGAELLSDGWDGTEGTGGEPRFEERDSLVQQGEVVLHVCGSRGSARWAGTRSEWLTREECLC